MMTIVELWRLSWAWESLKYINIATVQFYIPSVILLGSIVHIYTRGHLMKLYIASGTIHGLTCPLVSLTPWLQGQRPPLLLQCLTSPLPSRAQVHLHVAACWVHTSTHAITVRTCTAILCSWGKRCLGGPGFIEYGMTLMSGAIHVKLLPCYMYKCVTVTVTAA